MNKHATAIDTQADKTTGQNAENKTTIPFSELNETGKNSLIAVIAYLRKLADNQPKEEKKI